ncbi:glutaredoxin family protein [soil metagenome]
MTSLLTRFFRPRAKASHLQIRVYSRKQCCCCHKALDLLREQQQRHGFVIETVDVDTDPALVEAHGLSVPVVEIDGKVRFRGIVNPVLLDRLLQAEGRGR